MAHGTKTKREKELKRITGWKHSRCVTFLREHESLDEQCAEITLACGQAAADAWRASRTPPAKERFADLRIPSAIIQRWGCACCGDPPQGKYSIHRDDFGEGPEVPLCNACGGQPEPSEVEIWQTIAKRGAYPEMWLLTGILAAWVERWGCAVCGKPPEGNYTTRRAEPWSEPEVPLCDACFDAGRNVPLADTWAAIAARGAYAEMPLQPAKGRRGESARP